MLVSGSTGQGIAISWMAVNQFRTVEMENKAYWMAHEILDKAEHELRGSLRLISDPDRPSSWSKDEKKAYKILRDARQYIIEN